MSEGYSLVDFDSVSIPETITSQDTEHTCHPSHPQPEAAALANLLSPGLSGHLLRVYFGAVCSVSGFHCAVRPHLVSLLMVARVVCGWS